MQYIFWRSCVSRTHFKCQEQIQHKPQTILIFSLHLHHSLWCSNPRHDETLPEHSSLTPSPFENTTLTTVSQHVARCRYSSLSCSPGLILYVFNYIGQRSISPFLGCGGNGEVGTHDDTAAGHCVLWRLVNYTVHLRGGKEGWSPRTHIFQSHVIKSSNSLWGT